MTAISIQIAKESFAKFSSIIKKQRFAEITRKKGKPIIVPKWEWDIMKIDPDRNNCRITFKKIHTRLPSLEDQKRFTKVGMPTSSNWNKVFLCPETEEIKAISFKIHLCYLVTPNLFCPEGSIMDRLFPSNKIAHKRKRPRSDSGL